MKTPTPAERLWAPLCLALEHPELENDPRYDTEDRRLANAELLVGIFDEILTTRPQDEWLHVFGEYDLFC